ncbi:CPBP family intramembrane glutamic endopeptidase [Rhodococcus sp. NPDC058521]|uniref:CPBP family intramembrane glutamic endopeptidase n=1 Tax=Rhodococcus sp. NPDC058521 TaxID=3346536 RepID=UPI00366A030F
MRRAGSLVLAAALVGWNNAVLPRVWLSARHRALAGGAVGVALTAVAATRCRSEELGISTGRIPEGFRVGILASSVPAAAMLLAAAISGVRARVRDGAPREDFDEWVLLHIPVGTVLAEELMFRSVLAAALRSAWSPRQAIAIHAGAFGLWHVYPARAAGDNVLATVAFTAASGVLFEALRARSGSVVAPALLHLTVNIGGVLLTRPELS